MKKETLKDWIKRWPVEIIVQSIFVAGIEYEANRRSLEEITESKKIAIKELKSRIKQLK